MRPLGCRETSENKHPTTRRHIPEELLPHPQRFEKLKISLYLNTLFGRSQDAVQWRCFVTTLYLCCIKGSRHSEHMNNDALHHQGLKLKIRDASQGITVHKSNFENQLWYIYLSTLSYTVCVVQP